MKSRTRQQGGFTLAELMVTVAVIGVLAAVAVVSVDPDDKARTARGYTDTIASQLDLARQRAIATQRIQRLFIDTGSIQLSQAPDTGMLADYEITVIDGASTWEVIQDVDAPDRVSVVSFDTGSATHLEAGNSVPADGDGLPATLLIRPDGTIVTRAGGTAGTIFVGNDNRERLYRIVVFRITGTVTVFENW